MTYRLDIRPDAVADIEVAGRWYDEQQKGLGSEFVHEVLKAISSLIVSPHYHIRHKRKNVRWKLLDRFPYRVVFQMKEDVITVIAVIHSARNDRNWRARL